MACMHLLFDLLSLLIGMANLCFLSIERQKLYVCSFHLPIKGTANPLAQTTRLSNGKPVGLDEERCKTDPNFSQSVYPWDLSQSRSLSKPMGLPGPTIGYTQAAWLQLLAGGLALAGVIS